MSVSIEEVIGTIMIAEGEDFERIKKAFRSRRDINQEDQLRQFKIKDIVTFDHSGRTITGRIKAINQKSISVTTPDMRWRVHPSLLREATKEEKEQYEKDPMAKAMEQAPRRRRRRNYYDETPAHLA